jgi:hypothetical protein
LRRISPIPNTPIPRIAKSIPSASSLTPKVMRSWPVTRSGPIVDSSTPNTIAITALNIDPWASAAANTSPRSISEKNSTGPNRRAMLVIGMARPATKTVATLPAKKEPMAEMPSAIPARPRLAISWPSMHVTVELASPGMDIRMAVVELPYCAP